MRRATSTPLVGRGQDAGRGLGKINGLRDSSRPQAEDSRRTPKSRGRVLSRTRFRLMTAIRRDFFRWSIFFVRAVAAPTRVAAPTSRKKREGDEGCGSSGAAAGTSGTAAVGFCVFIKMLVGVGRRCAAAAGGRRMGGFFRITAVTYREAAVIRPRGGGKPRPVRKPINELMKNYDFHVWSRRRAAWRGGTSLSLKHARNSDRIAVSWGV